MKSILYVLLFFLVLMLAITALVGCSKEDTRLADAFEDFSQVLKQEDLDGLRLTIYYVDPSILMRPLHTVDDLIQHTLTKKIVVDNAQLREHLTLLQNLKADAFIPVEKESQSQVQLCYLFEADHKGVVLEITQGAAYNDSYTTVHINGVEVEPSELLADIVAPFVTGDVMTELGYIFRGELMLIEET